MSDWADGATTNIFARSLYSHQLTNLSEAAHLDLYHAIATALRQAYERGKADALAELSETYMRNSMS